MINIYFSKNKLLNILLLISISIIISFQITKNMPVLFDIDKEIVNYYYEILVNLSIGYIISLIFYIIVVFYPEEKRKKMINTKTSIIFARLQTHLRNYIFEILEAFNIPFKETNNINQVFIDKIRGFNAYQILNKPSKNSFSEKKKSSFDILVKSSEAILRLRQELIPFLMFLNEEEIDFYTEIEDIFIFENIKNLKNGFAVEGLFYNDFEYIITAYNKVQKIVGATQIKVQWEKDDFR